MQGETDNAMEHIALVARAMTDAEPPADLEARIKRRLDAVTQDVAPRWWPRYLYGAAGIAVGIIAIATLVRSPEVPESRSPGVSTFRSPEVVAVQTPEPRDPGTPEPRDPGTSGPRDPGTSLPSQAELAWMARRIPALERIEALTVNPMVFESIQPEPMSITPLTMTPLVTSPVHGDPDAGRQ